MNLRNILAAFLLAVSMAIAPSWAVEPNEMLTDPALEARAQEISQHLRCVVCQNQTIDDSNADLAHDMRLLVRERLAAGDSDQEVMDYVVERYGNFVLLRPPFQPDTWALWITPFAVLLLAVGGLLVRRPVAPAVKPLSGEERRRLEQHVGGDPTESGEN